MSSEKKPLTMDYRDRITQRLLEQNAPWIYKCLPTDLVCSVLGFLSTDDVWSALIPDTDLSIDSIHDERIEVPVPEYLLKRLRVRIGDSIDENYDAFQGLDFVCISSSSSSSSTKNRI